MNIPLIAGRSFTSEDTSHSAIVNEPLRESILRPESIGGRVGYSEQTQQTVIVLSATAPFESRVSPEPQVYLSFVNDEDWRFIVVRSAIPAPTVISEMRAALKSIGPNLAAAIFTRWENWYPHRLRVEGSRPRSSPYLPPLPCCWRWQACTA